MQEDVKRLRQLLDEGRCCAVALVQLSLELRNEENERLLQATSALCGGVQSKLLCGALTGAACMMNVLDPKNANAFMVPELVQWFAKTFGEEYGGMDCADILEGDAGNKKERCLALIEATYLKAKEIMEKHGCAPD